VPGIANDAEQVLLEGYKRFSLHPGGIGMERRQKLCNFLLYLLFSLEFGYERLAGAILLHFLDPVRTPPDQKSEVA
jgi:hypothetical protein